MLRRSIGRPLIELLAKSHAGHEVGDAPMTRAEFQGQQGKPLMPKARDLGWIV
jgi:hypothetical protein